MKNNIFKKLVCFNIALCCVLSASACDAISGMLNKNSCTSTTQPAEVDYLKQDKPLVQKAMADGELSVLTLGNSFSVDAMEYAYEIAQNLRLNVRLGNLYEPGCSIGQHLTYATKGATKFAYYLCEDGNWSKTDNYKSLDAVQSYNWDYIVLQHDPDQSGWKTTYSKLPELISLVKANCPSATIVWHMTWAYQSDSTQTAFKQYNNDQMEMYRQIIDATKTEVLEKTEISMIIPSGTVIQNARTSTLGDTLTRDGYHLSLDNGRFIAGLSYIAKLSGADIQQLTYTPEGVSQTTKAIAIASVEKALRTPFAVSKVSI